MIGLQHGAFVMVLNPGTEARNMKGMGQVSRDPPTRLSRGQNGKTEVRKDPWGSSPDFKPLGASSLAGRPTGQK